MKSFFIFKDRKNSIFLQAIRDGVIEAVLDHESGTMQSKDTSDVYSTRFQDTIDETVMMNSTRQPFSDLL